MTKRLPIAVALLAASVAMAASPETRPTTRPSTRRSATTTSAPVMDPTAPKLEAREWCVFVMDAADATVNADGIVPNELPAFVGEKRFSPPNARPKPGEPTSGTDELARHPTTVPTTGPVMPVGVIRFAGSFDGKIDVSLKVTRGSFPGYWPRASERAAEIIWRDLTVSDKPGVPAQLVPADSWFAQLRAGDPAAAFANIADGARVQSEPFLLYDAKLPLGSPFTVKESAGFTVDVANNRDTVIRDVVLFQGDGDTVRSAVVGDLMPTTGPTTMSSTAPATTRSTTGPATTRSGNRPATTKATALTPAVEDSTVLHTTRTTRVNPITGATVTTVTETRVAKAGAATPTAPAATTTPTTLPAGATHVVLSVPATRPTPAMMIAPYRPAMTAAGVTDADADLIARTVARYATDGKRLTAVYRVDPAAWDRLMPLEIVPQPAHIRRFALIVVRNVDPSAGSAVDDLVAQLGSDDWSARDAATKKLLALGPAAVKKLQTASHNADVEVAWRAERVLQLVNPQDLNK